jgi:hypothetical protein
MMKNRERVDGIAKYVAEHFTGGTLGSYLMGALPNATYVGFAELEGVSDIETLNKVLERAVTLTGNVEPMGYKAFLVGVDREACALYKDALDRYLPSEYSEVVISPAHNDTADLRRFHYDDSKELEIRKAFRKAESTPKILIVTEKLLTGIERLAHDGVDPHQRLVVV